MRTVVDVACTRLTARVRCTTSTFLSQSARQLHTGSGRVLGVRRVYSYTAPAVPVAAVASTSATRAVATSASRAVRRSMAGVGSSAAMGVAEALSNGQTLTGMRFARNRSAAPGDEQKPPAEDAKPEEAEAKAKAEGAAEGEAGAKPEGEAAQEEPKQSQFAAWKQDLVRYPEIYNSANMINMALFTIFCLCSTGTESESTWWTDQWGVDNSFRPWTWPLHSLLCNNFLAMTFAMIMMHSYAHGVMAAIGSQKLLLFCAIVATFSGVAIWASNTAAGYDKEKQFGPWDVLAALSILQYSINGQTPWALLLSFNGWVKYANLVGAVCIVYYDWQPLCWGTVAGLALTRVPMFKPLAAAV